MCCPDPEPRAELEFDSRYTEILSPWDGREAPHMQATATSLHEFTPYAYPLEIINLLRIVIRKMQRERSDIVVIETGIGQGYTTRRLGPLMRPEHDLYWAYESDDEWRMQISLRDFWLRYMACCIKEWPTPETMEYRSADLVILDSDYPWIYTEFYAWMAARKWDSVLVTPHVPPGFGPGELESRHLADTKYVIGRGEEVDAIVDLWTAMFERDDAVL